MRLNHVTIPRSIGLIIYAYRISPVSGPADVEPIEWDYSTFWDI